MKIERRGERQIKGRGEERQRGEGKDIKWEGRGERH